MSYKQNNPLSRKNSPLNKDDRWIQKATESIKKRGTEGVCTGDKFGGPTCPPGSKRYTLAKTFKAMAKKGDGVSRKPSEKPSTKPVEETRMTKGDQMPSRKSSDETGMHDTDESFAAAVAAESAKPAHDPFSGDFAPDVSFEERVRRESMMEESDPFNERSGGKKTGPRRKSSSPLNNTGITGLNYSKELRYNAVDDITQGKGEADYGFSRESSSPLDYGSWAHKDAERAKEKYAEGDYAWGHALGIDEHDADYAKHWHKDEAEHGPSRKSRSERLRSRAMKRSERTGAEWGDYDYEDPRVQKLLQKARDLDERSGKEMKTTMTKTLKPLPKKKA